MQPIKSVSRPALMRCDLTDRNNPSAGLINDDHLGFNSGPRRCVGPQGCVMSSGSASVSTISDPQLAGETSTTRAVTKHRGSQALSIAIALCKYAAQRNKHDELGGNAAVGTHYHSLKAHTHFPTAFIFFAELRAGAQSVIYSGHLPFFHFHVSRIQTYYSFFFYFVFKMEYLLQLN